MTQSKPQREVAQRLALAVRLGEDLHAIPIEWVEEVLPALPIECIPRCPTFVRGIIFVRGHLIPVVSAAERLGLPDYRRPPEPHIVCLRIDDRLVGVEFDEALDLVALDTMQTVSAESLGAQAGFFSAMLQHDGRLVRLLDPRRLFDPAEAAGFEAVPQAP